MQAMEGVDNIEDQTPPPEIMKHTFQSKKLGCNIRKGQWKLQEREPRWLSKIIRHGICAQRTLLSPPSIITTTTAVELAVPSA